MRSFERWMRVPEDADMESDKVQKEKEPKMRRRDPRWTFTWMRI